jgi:hypothetical protein
VIGEQDEGDFGQLRIGIHQLANAPPLTPEHFGIEDGYGGFNRADGRHRFEAIACREYGVSAMDQVRLHEPQQGRIPICQHDHSCHHTSHGCQPLPGLRTEAPEWGQKTEGRL